MDLEITTVLNPPKLYGRRDDDWILVEYADFMVNMFTDDAREDIDLENKWRNPPDEDEVEEENKEDSKLKRKWAKYYKPMKFKW